ncbi:MAG: hypothetical protein WDN50_10145 [Bradyrhizobium sp.]
MSAAPDGAIAEMARPAANVIAPNATTRAQTVAICRSSREGLCDSPNEIVQSDGERDQRHRHAVIEREGIDKQAEGLPDAQRGAHDERSRHDDEGCTA